MYPKIYFFNKICAIIYAKDGDNMKNKIKLFFYNNRRWIYCLEYIVYSVILLAIVTYIDSSYSGLTQYVPRVMLSSVELAKTVLSSLVSALLTITTFTFSTILTVFTLYHNSFTPRSVENFLDKKITMKVLGIFIGGFVYCLVSLNFMKAGQDQRLVIAGTIGVIYAIWGAIYFVIFVQNVLSGMNYTNLLEDIATKTDKLIDKEVNEREFDLLEKKEWTMKKKRLAAPESGYLEIIDIDKIKKLLEDEDIVFTIEASKGDFVVQKETLGYFSKDCLDDETIEKIQKQFIFSERRIAEEDYKEGIRKIVEIATRALSPGTNDPNTAIHCIKKLSILFSHLAKVDSNHHYIKTDGKARIYYTSKSFKELLVEHMLPICTYGDTDSSVLQAIFKGLLVIKVSASEKNKKIVMELAEDLYQSVVDNFKRESDLGLFMDIYQKIMTETKEEKEIEEEDKEEEKKELLEKK